jgi:hypothetical protein
MACSSGGESRSKMNGQRHENVATRLPQGGEPHPNNGARHFGATLCAKFKLESLILAQNERWRRA